MKQLRSSGKLLCAALLLLLYSCTGNEKKSGTETPAADTVSKMAEAAPPAAVSTISTTPQSMLVIRMKVADFAKWKAGYDGRDSIRLSMGMHNYVIGRGLADSNMVLVALKSDDIDKAKAYAKDPTLKPAMQKAGVIGSANFLLGIAVYQDTMTIPSNIRSMTINTVKDRDAWRKAFDEGKQERLDNGIIERVICNDPDNDKKVILVTALTDTAKAYAYFSSDALKKRREASGVIGTPERFVFQVVKRY